MSDLIIACKERKFHFGFFSNSFEHCIPLDQVWISPFGNQSNSWKFESGDGKFGGDLIHMGNYLDSSPIHFSHKGVVFIKRSDDRRHFGFFFEKIAYKIKVSENIGRFLKYAQIKKYPPQIAKDSYFGIYKYKRKTVYIIDPVKFAKLNRSP